MIACLVHVFYLRQTENYISQQTNKLLLCPVQKVFFISVKPKNTLVNKTNKLSCYPFIRISFHLRQTENCKDFSHVNIRPQL